MTRDTYLQRSLGTLANRIKEVPNSPKAPLDFSEASPQSLVEELSGSLKAPRDDSLWSLIKESRVLLVGAGGIGCELLKNLLLTGFGEIHLIDLDTIDLSNLNRQFLFRLEHIKKSKALVAKEVAQKFQPSAKIEAYHANIKDSQFDVDWFASFNVVFNALDNLDARRHVNKMCLAADVPLIESGTTGFNGQVQVIKKSKTECYDCNSKEVPKSFPVCTIRSTPSQPIHCIVWAKSYLLPELFGTSETDSEEFDYSADADNAKEIAQLQKEARALQEIRNSMGSTEFTQKVFDKVFKDDINRLRGMEDMWKARKPPEPLDLQKMKEALESIEPTISSKDQEVWSLPQNLVVFKDSLDRLSKRLKILQDSPDGSSSPILTFDKDDVDTLDFVTASANLRATIFDIERKSKFDTKQMAGNIIPAIATTNAMTAGLCVLQSLKVLKDDYRHAKMVFLERSGARAINSDSLNPPNPNCPICSVTHAKIKIDLERATLNELVEDILRQQVGYGEEFSVNTEQGIIYDPDLEDNLPKNLSELGIKPSSFITVVDEDDDPRVNLQLVVVAPESQEQAIVLDKVPRIPRKPKAPTPTPEIEQTNGTSNLGKRKRDADGADIEINQEHPTKRVANGSTTDGDKSNPINLDETVGGAILIDDD